MNESDEVTPVSAVDVAGIGVRLRRVEGQIRGIARMVEDDRSCEDVVTQLLAVRSAMDRVTGEIVRLHVDRCVRDLPAELMRDEINRIVTLLNKIN